MRQYYVCILANRSGMLYTGVTNNLERRVYQHKHKMVPGFTSRYNIDRLVYYASTTDVRAAIAREKQIKGWLRAMKVALIESVNRDWKDLAADWFPDIPCQTPSATHDPRRDPSSSPAGDSSG
ncbi:MAG TPA: GIY-YIG nuclease family protein [Phycisphaerae bacterium]|nr:GIY-YIG nuclease family protein [Phycisphaerae bacterium]